MIDAKLIGISFVVIVAAATLYVTNQKSERAARADAGLNQLAGSQYDAVYADQVDFVCASLLAAPDTWDPCALHMCRQLESGAITSETKINYPCGADKNIAISFFDAAGGDAESWFLKGLEDPYAPMTSGQGLCEAHPESNEGSDALGPVCAIVMPYFAATVAVEHWRYVNRAHLGKFSEALNTICADPAFADGCPEALNGFKPSPAGEKFAVECPDDLGVAVFNLIDLVTELDAIVLADGGEAEVKELIFGKCSTGRRLDEDDVVAFNAPFSKATYESGLAAAAAAAAAAVPDHGEDQNDYAACFSENNCVETDEGCDDADFASCSMACDAGMCTPDGNDGNDDRRLAVDTDTMFDFLDETETNDDEPATLGALLKKQHGSAKAKEILELRSQLHERQGEMGVRRDSRELGWAHVSGRRRRWGPYTHHHHSPHGHSPHSHTTPADCKGCWNRDGNVCFGRCGPGCSKWNSCGCDNDDGNDGTGWNGDDVSGGPYQCGANAFKACVWHDSYCGRGMTDMECMRLVFTYTTRFGVPTSIQNTASLSSPSDICAADEEVRHPGWTPVNTFGGSIGQTIFSAVMGSGNIEDAEVGWLGFNKFHANGRPSGAMPLYGVHTWGTGWGHVMGNKCETCQKIGWDGNACWAPWGAKGC